MSETWTVTKLLDWTTEYFKKHGIEWPHLEAEILLSHTLAVPRIQLYVQFERILKDDELAKYKALILRRSKHEPIAYITGHQPFMSLDFEVNPSVLIPRPETEKLVEIGIETGKLIEKPEIADIGVGSGSIAVSLAKYLPKAKIVGVDSSKEALEVAKRNAEKVGVADRCEFIHGDLFEPIKGRAFDIIVSNPPYIKSADIPTLQPEIKDFEPREALDGGEDGLKFFREIADKAKNHLKENGKLLLEIGFGQGDQIKALLLKAGFTEITITKDTSGIERVIKAK